MTIGAFIAAVIGYGVSLVCLVAAVMGAWRGPGRMQMPENDFVTGLLLLLLISFAVAVITSTVTGV